LRQGTAQSLHTAGYVTINRWQCTHFTGARYVRCNSNSAIYIQLCRIYLGLRMAQSVYWLWCALDNPGINCQERNEIFLSPKSRGRPWKPRTLLFKPYRAPFPPDVKRPELGTDHWPLSSAGLENQRHCISTYSYAFMMCTVNV